MLIKTLLSQLENFKGFVFGKVSLRKRWFKKPTLVVVILPGREAVPNVRYAAGRDRCTIPAERPGRSITSLWSYRVVFRFFPRRVRCPRDGIQGEWVPWVDGKEQMTHSYKIFLVCRRRSALERRS